MADSNDSENENLDDYTTKKVTEGIENLLEEKDLKIKWRKELEDNPAVQAYFDEYRGNPMKSFIDNYLNTKYLSHQYGDMYKKMVESKQERYINEAHRQLEYILQKQLFDMQCLWRAGQLDIAGIEVTNDFKVWEADILNCPFLEAISKDDIAMYQTFLDQKNLDPAYLDNYLEWQNYDEIKESYTLNNDDEYQIMPDWYEFHNNRTGKGSLLLLPDHKGEQESFYIKIFRDNEAKNSEKPINIIPTDDRPFLSSYDNEVIKFFVNTFEDSESQKKYKYYIEGSKNSDNYDLKNTIDCIVNADDLIPVESHFNVLEAIDIAYNSYYLKKIAEHLPMAYEQYLFSKKMGFDFESKKDSFYISLSNDLKQIILAGRKLNGEEQNFNY